MSSSPPVDPPTDLSASPSPDPTGGPPPPAILAPSTPSRRLSLLPTSLTGRLVLTSIALVAAVSVVVAIVTTLALRNFLLTRLDNQLVQAVGRSEGAVRHGTDQPPDQLCQPGDEGPGGQVLGQGPGSLNGILGGNCPHAQVVSEDGTSEGLSSRALAALGRVPVDEAPHTVEVAGFGSYRVVVRQDGDLAFVTGLPTSDVNATVGRLIGWEAVVALVGVALAAVAGYTLVRRQLRPLREVATTAGEVTRTPLDTGLVGTTARVPDEYTRPDNEVGQLGGALNLMLGHVERALDARHESEQQVRQFLADASHELRTPLSTIAGYAELSRRTAADDHAELERLRHAMRRVDVESERMTSLVDDLLLLARLDAGRPLESGQVDVGVLAVEALNDARVVAPDHRWRLVLPEDPALVHGDRRRLHQVVTNLLSNARRHTPPGTVVSVTVGVSDAVTLTVHDDGQGLPPGLHEHAFERFARGDGSRTRDTGGSGLGLAIVRAIVEAHGGTAEVSSRPGDTSFVVRLRLDAG